mgnify:CR=1 FL=1
MTSFFVTYSVRRDSELTDQFKNTIISIDPCPSVEEGYIAQVILRQLKNKLHNGSSVVLINFWKIR